MLEIDGQTVYFSSSESMSQVPDSSVDLFITSPPYWNLKKYGHGAEIGQSTYDHYLERLDRVWQECLRVGKDSSVLVINVNTRRFQKRFYAIPFDIASRMQGWTLWDHVIWYIPNALPQCDHYRERLLDNKFESCLVFTKQHHADYKFHKPRVPQKYAHADPRTDKKNAKGRCVGNVIRIPAYRPPNVKKLGYHISAYPEELVAFFLECYTDPSDLVLDPFLGSGTTLKVCRVMGRRGIGYEINEAYQDLIAEKTKELWEVPDWRTLDIIHSSTMETGMAAPRKIQYVSQKRAKQDVLFPSMPPWNAEQKKLFSP